MPEKPLINFTHLSSAAASLNKASDELTQLIGSLDDALSRLNIGIPTWVEIAKWVDPEENGAYEREELGFSKIDGVWRIGIRRLNGNEDSPMHDEVRDIWWFNDAPRELRLRAIEKLPVLFEELAKVATKAADAVNKKLSEAKLFAIGIGLREPKAAK